MFLYCSGYMASISRKIKTYAGIQTVSRNWWKTLRKIHTVNTFISLSSIPVKDHGTFDVTASGVSLRLVIRIGKWKCLMTHYWWQKWKRVFLSCYCNEIYRVEAIGLRNSNYS